MDVRLEQLALATVPLLLLLSCRARAAHSVVYRR